MIDNYLDEKVRQKRESKVEQLTIDDKIIYDLAVEQFKKKGIYKRSDKPLRRVLMVDYGMNVVSRYQKDKATMIADMRNGNSKQSYKGIERDAIKYLTDYYKTEVLK